MSTLSTFRINQPPGTPYAEWDRARRDIDLYSVASEKVECEALNKAETTYLWEMVSMPFGASVTINNDTTHTCDFEINTRGSYLIRLTVNEGTISESRTTWFFGVPLEKTGYCLPALNEVKHDNSQFPYDGARGSEEKMNVFFQKVDDVSTGTDEDAIHDNVNGEINAITEKATPVSADLVLIEDSAAANAKKKVQVGNLLGTDADAIHDNVDGEINAVAEKAIPVSADLVLIEDSAASNAKKKVQVGNLPSTDTDAIHDNVDGEINAVAEKAIPVSADLVLIEDSAASNAKKKVQVGNLLGTDADAIHDNVAGEINAIAAKATPVNADLMIIEDSADSNNKKKIELGNLPEQFVNAGKTVFGGNIDVSAVTLQAVLDEYDREATTKTWPGVFVNSLKKIDNVRGQAQDIFSCTLFGIVPNSSSSTHLSPEGTQYDGGFVMPRGCLLSGTARINAIQSGETYSEPKIKVWDISFTFYNDQGHIVMLETKVTTVCQEGETLTKDWHILFETDDDYETFTIIGRTHTLAADKVVGFQGAFRAQLLNASYL